ncbi:hypothetical protein SLEP1_g59763 [Rubroshorea leprosula]|uniref:Uncharacterized protein n=1 Tax=Rubroshorea leprosula TaxID=152421 RepID=A0AAV5MUE9_9ROSI|nr:hypothetical protein SLEP1_g59763 [Rubroshorea leprosula]
MQVPHFHGSSFCREALSQSSQILLIYLQIHLKFR